MDEDKIIIYNDDGTTSVYQMNNNPDDVIENITVSTQSFNNIPGFSQDELDKLIDEYITQPNKPKTSNNESTTNNESMTNKSATQTTPTTSTPATQTEEETTEEQTGTELNNDTAVTIEQIEKQIEKENKKWAWTGSTEDILKDFSSFDEMNVAIVNMVGSPTQCGKITVEQTNEGIRALYEFKNNLDQFGKAIKFGSNCPVCGKEMKNIPPGGYCSIKCVLSDIEKRVLNQRTKTNDIDGYINQIKGCLDALTLIFNMVAEFPNKLIQIAKLPDRYRNFLQIRINILFIMVKIAIDKVMICKNDIIIALLNPVKNGIYSDKIVGYYDWALTAINTVQQIYITADTIYQSFLQALQNPVFSIPPESYVWMMTPRSFFRHPGLLYVPVPTNLATNPMNGIMSSLDIEKIDKIVRGMFPPITSPEYLMPPSAFRYRLALSPQSPIVYTIIQKLSEFLKTGPEYLPKYKDLKLTNIFFIWAILEGWAPRSQEFFGSFILPNA